MRARSHRRCKPASSETLLLIFRNKSMEGAAALPARFTKRILPPNSPGMIAPNSVLQSRLRLFNTNRKKPCASQKHFPLFRLTEVHIVLLDSWFARSMLTKKHTHANTKHAAVTPDTGGPTSLAALFCRGSPLTAKKGFSRLLSCYYRTLMTWPAT